jgi:glycosyltransferase involved in cell wall biosynthesis
MNTVYLYPKVIASENPYMKDLEHSMAVHYKIINKTPNNNGVADLFKYLLQADIYYFNWIESLAARRFGKIQIIAFVLFLIIAKCLKKKIVWTLHNKYAHDKSKNIWVDFMFRIMLKYSELIITHSQSGVDFVKERNQLWSKKTKYFIHPIRHVFPFNVDNQKYTYDFLIWGTIWPYKGVVEFLQFLKETGNTHYKVLIVGICINEQMKIDLESYLTDNVIHMNNFYEMKDIAGFANQTKFTLFTYKPVSVLSSGSLMDSIGMGSAIIGPNTGAFKDLSSYNFINTYDTYSDIISFCNNSKLTGNSTLNEIKSFCNENSWPLFGESLNKALISNLKISG